MTGRDRTAHRPGYGSAGAASCSGVRGAGWAGAGGDGVGSVTWRGCRVPLVRVPAASPPPVLPGGCPTRRPDPHHGGTGGAPDVPRSRRVPGDDAVTGPGAAR